ncbi:MAG: ATP-dependent DNA helicase, partial [Burkholderiaceae bacterium]|nr:ATP-dependent DNA helicase [Burkholderiaceae bacterium]
PGDPLVEARTQRIEAAGGRAFQTYALPEAAVALKQGAGRLIRRESDHGILVVCDPRLLTKGYGKRLVAVLPPMRRLETPESFQEALQALAEITRTSTKDPIWS